ncbi:heat shock protein DnaJ domain protein [Halothece sp. PCC 7418]|uniref:CPP1-like family protein n=1 Tax=Halothece sp. (strain PCC 7418) TaxID=65093 RepID=UPI0002A07595|nr:CPP1-like family protein [Halothece sp. PCC 7418]AFZ42733.1 heat shock protein DnaJ domain protein [Halothece sp. PCC 7418]
MSEQNPYEQLGVTEDASFEEIQEAKVRLTKEYEDDQRQKEAVEAAYDSIIMDRLRLRQEGKIKVPERIRFPERAKPAKPKPQAPNPASSPAWLQRLLDTPSRNDLLISAGIFVLLVAITLSSGDSASVMLALGFAATAYLLNRKENRLGRSLLITLASLLIGVGLGAALAPVVAAGMASEQFTALTTLFLFWLSSSFLR